MSSKLQEPSMWMKELILGDDSGTMGAGTRWFLLVYQLAAGVALLYAVYGLWGAVPPGPQPVPAPDPERLAATAPELPEETEPRIAQIIPERIASGSDRRTIQVVGHNFDETTRILFNDAERAAHVANANELVVSLDPDDLLAPGEIVVTAANSQSPSPRGATLHIDPPKAGTWHVFGFHHGGADPDGEGDQVGDSHFDLLEVSAEVRVLLMVIFIGAFGATIMGLQSLADYRGNKELMQSWAIFYFVRPAVGAGAAVLFYLVLRGGLLRGTIAEAETVTPAGTLAISALVGMFADKAVLKLREVFNVLFQPDEEARKNKLGAPSIRTSSLPVAKKGEDYPATSLSATGGTPPYAWAVTPGLPEGLELSSEGIISGKPTETKPKAAYKFTVTDAKGETATSEIELEVQ